MGIFEAPIIIIIIPTIQMPLGHFMLEPRPRNKFHDCTLWTEMVIGWKSVNKFILNTNLAPVTYGIKIFQISWQLSWRMSGL